MSQEHFFPSYWLEVALTWALVVMPIACGATYLSARQQEAEEPAQTQPTKSIVSAAFERDIELPIIPPEQHTTRVISDDDLAHDIVIEGTTSSYDELALGLGQFEQAAEQFEDTGRHVGVVISDLGTGTTLSYGADEVFYPASSVKGPYVISVYESMVDGGLITTSEVNRLVEPTIVESDNGTYRALRNLCGSQVFADWAVDCGAVEPGTKDYDQFLNRYYPFMTTKQLACMWEHAFTYLNSGTDGARELVDYFNRRVESPIRAGVDDDDLTITKAGWYPGDAGPDYMATVDAGIVLDGSHGYVVAIMTDAPDDLEALAELVPGIYSATAALD